MAAAAGLPRAARLLTPRDYQRVFATGRRLVVSPLAIVVSESPDGVAQARLGLAIGKKHARRAVVRNRLKRLARESFRHHRRQLPALDIVIYPVAGINDRHRRDLARSLEQLWNRLHRVYPTSSATC